MEGYVNIDGYPTESRGGSVAVADRYMMIEDLDYPDNSVDEIICIHTLEHLTQKQVEKAFLNWFRCLKPGGSLTIEVPNAEAIMRRLLWARSQTRKDLYYYLLYGTQEFEAEHHRMGHTYARLVRVLRAAGFTNFVNGKKNPVAIRDKKVYLMFRGRRWRAVLLQCEKPVSGPGPDPDLLRQLLYFKYHEQDLHRLGPRAALLFVRVLDRIRLRRG